MRKQTFNGLLSLEDDSPTQPALELPKSEPIVPITIEPITIEPITIEPTIVNMSAFVIPGVTNEELPAKFASERKRMKELYGITVPGQLVRAYCDLCGTITVSLMAYVQNRGYLVKHVCWNDECDFEKVI